MEWLEKYQEVREMTEKICRPLEVEDYVVQSMEDVSPAKWHLAHTTWFFENMILKSYQENYKVFHERFNQLFNSYYQSFGQPWIRSQRGTLSRPTVKEIYEYRHYVDSMMQEFLAIKDLSNEVIELLEIGLHHEQQHQELLLMDIKHIFSCNPLKPVYGENESLVKNEENFKKETLPVVAGTYSIGCDGKSFSYDNEKPRHQVLISDFSIESHLVTNSEYAEFIQSGGYERFEFWHADAWEMIQSRSVKMPMYWRRQENGKTWTQMTLMGEKELQSNEPVCHVNYFEASAFANWAGKRLPTEAEWEVACQKYSSFENSHFLEEACFHPKSIEKTNYGFLGGLWEWTSSSYQAYPRYKLPQGALGEYNSKFMVNQQVLRGGSFASSKAHIRTTYRNFFQPEKAWAFCGFRLVEDQ